MNLKVKIYSDILLACICFSCYMPPVYLFTDARLLPKWYLFVSVLAVTGQLAAVAWLRGKPLPDGIGALASFGKVFTIATALECLWVVVCIVKDGLRPVGEVGTLSNPAELALHLCIAIPIAVMLAMGNRERKWLALYGAAAVLFVSVLWLTQSRTGLICLALDGIIGLCLLALRLVRRKGLRRVLYGVLALALLAGTLLYVASHKTASTSGRAFILQRSWELVAEHPLIGHGHRGFEREYMLRQADFFREHPGSEYAMLADEIHHPLNEFVHVWVNYGIVAPLLLFLLLVLPLWRWRRGDRRMRPFLLPVLAILVFSCFSYPFYYPIAWLTVGAAALCALRSVLRRWQKHAASSYLLPLFFFLVFGAAVVDAVQEHRWYRAYRHSFRDVAALEEYEELHSYFKRNPAFLYSYAMASFKRGDLDRAARLIEECGQHWNGYNRELLAGDICSYREEYPDAIVHYEAACAMCPVRFAPLEGLYKVYDLTGDEERRNAIARQIADKDIKVYSSAIWQIKENCK